MSTGPLDLDGSSIMRVIKASKAALTPLIGVPDLSAPDCSKEGRRKGAAKPDLALEHKATGPPMSGGFRVPGRRQSRYMTPGSANSFHRFPTLFAKQPDHACQPRKPWPGLAYAVKLYFPSHQLCARMCPKSDCHVNALLNL